MPLFDSPESFYLKLNLLFFVAFVLWLVISCCGRALSIKTSKKGKLSSARWLLVSVLVMPFLFHWLAIQSPVGSLSGFNGEIPRLAGFASTVSERIAVIAEMEQLSTDKTKVQEKIPVIQQENLLLLFWVLVVPGITWRLTKTVREAMALRRLIRESQVYKQIGSITVLYSDATTIPLATRFIDRAYIVIPSAMLLSKKDVKMVFLHEGEHLRNGDLWWSWLMECLSVLCFWNPAVYGWKITLHNLQEYACDETLMERKIISEQDYGRCLLNIAAAALHKHFPLSTSMGMWPSCFNKPVSLLKRRIAMLAEKTTRLANVLQVTSRILMIGIIGIFSVVVFGAAQVQEKKIAIEHVNDQKNEMSGIEQSQPEAAGAAIREDIFAISDQPATDDPVSESAITAVAVDDATVSALSIITEVPERMELKKPTRSEQPSKIQPTKTTVVAEEATQKAPVNVLLADYTDRSHNELMAAGENKEQPVNPEQNPVADTDRIKEKNTRNVAAETTPLTADAKVCRMIKTPGIEGERKACGTAENWKEYDQKLAFLGANTTCREFFDRKSRTIKAYCGTPGEWQKFDERNKRLKRRMATLDKGFVAAFPDNGVTESPTAANMSYTHIPYTRDQVQQWIVNEWTQGAMNQIPAGQGFK